MSFIGGEKRESNSSQEFSKKKVGLFEANIIAINPTLEEYKDVLGIELKEDSKAVEYLGEKEGNTTLRVDFWLEEVKNKEKFKVTYFLEDRIKENKDKTKKQYINTAGTTSWADDPNNLQEWFTAREYRPAFVGEEELYVFVKSWLNKLNYRAAKTIIQLEWKKLMKGNLSDLKNEINGEWSATIGALATVKTVDKDGETKEYQGVYNREFVSPFNFKYFDLVNYSDQKVLNSLRSKDSKSLKPHEKFVLKITGEYGCKDFYTLTSMKDYNPDDNLVASDAVISEDGADY
jgi:hypothetical protein